MAYRNYDLTQTEKEVLKDIVEDFLTIKQIKERRQCSFQAVYKIIKNLRNKGALDNSLNKVEKSQSTNPKGIRLHGQEFNIKIKSSVKYLKTLRKSNILFLSGNTIRLYTQSIEIYSGQSFIGKDENEAYKKSLEYWERFFARLTHELAIDILKDRSRIIREVNYHFARPNSEIAEKAIEEKVKIKVYAYEDGKLWFLTDDSFGMKEDETVHPKTAKEDRGKVDKYVNDWRDNEPMTNSEICKIQEETALNLNKLVNVIGDYGKHIKSHTNSIKTLSKAIPKLIKVLDDRNKKINDLQQRRLTEW